MKRAYVRTAMLIFAVAAVGCNDARPAMPTAASLFIPSIEGVWSGPMTLLGVSGGECAGAVVPSFLPSADQATVTFGETGTTVAATMTMESTGLACRYRGNATATGLTMNATDCDRTGLIISCIGGQARELRLVGSSVTAAWSGNQISGRMTGTYNVLTADQQKVGVGSLVASHSFTATRR